MQLNDRYFLNPAHKELAEARYFKKDENGLPVEQDIDEVFKREVACIYAKDTKDHAEEALRLRREKKILPAGRPLAQAGTDTTNYLNCFAAGTKVCTTNRGVVSIENIEVGDTVISHNGVKRKVQQVHKNKVNTRELFDLKCYRTPKVVVTSNHRFWSITREQIDWGECPQWNDAKYLRKGDYIAIPKWDGVQKKRQIDCLNVMNDIICNNEYYSVKKDDSDKLTLTTRWRNRGQKKPTCNRDHIAVNRFWNVDDEFAFMLGVWYGDGCVFSVKKYADKIIGLTFTLGQHERDLQQRILVYCDNLFGIPGKLRDTGDGSTQIRYDSTLIGMVFAELFGRGFAGKKILDDCFEWPTMMVTNLIAGLVSSDGTITQEGDVRVVMNNEALISSIYHLARQRGIPLGYSSTGNSYRLDFPKRHDIVGLVSKSYKDNRIQVAINKSASKFGIKEIDGVIFVRIDNKQKNNQKYDIVYNIGVEEDHSYSVEGIVCENCFVLGFESDTREAISELKRQHFNIQAQGGGTGINFSTLRPNGSICKSTQSRSSGAVGFITDISYQSSNVQQGGNRCLPGDALVAMADGSWKPIIDVRVNDKVMAFDKKLGKAVVSNVLDFYENGVQDIYEYILSSGKSVRSTNNHRWLGLQTDGSLLVREVGDMPDSSRKIGFISEIGVFGDKTSKWAGIIGYLIGDGCFTGETIKLSVQNDDVRARFIKSLPDGISFRENDESVFIKSDGELQDYLRHTSLFHCVSHEKFIPNDVFMYQRRDVIRVVEGLIASNGWINTDEIGFCSTSGALVEDFRRLLLKFGISGYIQSDNRSRKGKVRRTLWCMRIKHPDCYNKFMETFDVPGKSHKMLKKSSSIRHRRRDDCTFHKVKKASLVGQDLTFCIGIDHPDHLFIVDGAVSHNSGANMGVLEDWHPDLYEFITKKTESNWENIRKFATIYDEEGFNSFQWNTPYQWQMFNVSVFVSDKLMDLVTKGGKDPWVLSWNGVPWHLWEFVNTKTGKTFTVTAPTEDMAYFKASSKIPFFNNDGVELKKGPFDLTSGEWFSMICKNAWADGCPGIIFEGLARKYHNGEYFNPIDATNPCVPGYTWVMTSNGPRQVSDLVNNSFEALVDGKVYESKTGFFKTGRKKITTIRLDNGMSLDLTGNHKVLVSKNFGSEEWVETKNLRVGDLVVLHNHSSASIDGWKGEGSEDEGYLLGLLVGDGTITSGKAILSTWDSDNGVGGVREKVLKSCVVMGKRSDFSGWMTIKDRGEQRLILASVKELADKFEIDSSKQILESIEKASSDFYIGFLRGFFDADGSVQGNHRKGISIRLWQANRSRLEAVQRMLARLGVLSKIYYDRKPKRTEIIKGAEYTCAPGYELVISNMSIIEFNKKIGFFNTNKSSKLESLISSYRRSPNREIFCSAVSSIKREGKFVDVFDATVDEAHAFDANGLYVHNCAEQVLPKNAVCCLSSLILPTFFINGEFDWDEFERAIYQTVRGLDNIISLNKTGEAAIDANSVNERRIGLGTTGIGELLIMAGLKYSSQKGRNFVEKILEFLRDKAYEASIELAKERGVFPAYEYKGFSESEFFKTLPEHIRNLIRRNGIRNVTILTQAPVGCQKPDTMVVTDSGILELGEIVDVNGDKWQEHKYNVTQDIGKDRRSTMGFVNGFHKTKKIKMYSGIDLESTYNHQYRVFDIFNQEYVWRRADEIKAGDLLAVKMGGYTNKNEPALNTNVDFHANSKHIILPNQMSPLFARFLGIYFADGSNHEKGIRIAFNSEDVNLISKYEEIISKLFGMRDLYKENNGRGCTSLYVNSKPLLRFLEQNGLKKQKSYKVEIPCAVRSSSRESLRSFIEGYYDGDGSITYYNRYIDTVSAKMATQLAVCQRALGTNIRIEKYDNVKGSKGNRTKYRVKTIGFGSLDFDRGKYRYVARNRRKIAWLTTAVDKSLFFDEVVAVEDSQSMTLDIEVPSTHTYIANSIVSHNTTGTMIGYATGCEPYFAMCFRRNSRVGSFLDGSPAFMAWLQENEIDYAEYDYNLNKLREEVDVPEYFEEAHEIHWKDHLRMQAVFAKYIDSSVSKTINLPTDATISDVQNAYLMAYKLGIKSTTIYRDGSKQQILEHITKDTVKRPHEIIRAHAPKRPRELECDIFHTSVKGDKWTVLVGLLDGRPYEVFGAPQDNFEIAPKYKKGIMVKNGKGSYYLDTGDFKLKNISSYLKTDEHRVITRLISTCLRHGVSMPFISEQLAKADGTVVDFSKAIMRVLRRYSDSSLPKKDLVCSSCGSNNVILQSGCPSCLDCNVTKCD